MVREHVGLGWGDPLDPTKKDLWLCNGCVCVYDPMYAGRVELWTSFGRTDYRYALTNSGRAKEEEALCKARRFGENYRPWYADNYPHGDWEMHSRFD